MTQWTMQNSIAILVKVLHIRLLRKEGNLVMHLEVLQKAVCRYWAISINDTYYNARTGSDTVYVL